MAGYVSTGSMPTVLKNETRSKSMDRRTFGPVVEARPKSRWWLRSISCLGIILADGGVYGSVADSLQPNDI